MRSSLGGVAAFCFRRRCDPGRRTQFFSSRRDDILVSFLLMLSPSGLIKAAGHWSRRSLQQALSYCLEFTDCLGFCVRVGCIFRIALDYGGAMLMSLHRILWKTSRRLMIIATVLIGCGLYLKTASRYKQGGESPSISYFHTYRQY